MVNTSVMHSGTIGCLAKYTAVQWAWSAIFIFRHYLYFCVKILFCQTNDIG